VSFYTKAEGALWSWSPTRGAWSISQLE